MEIKFNVTGTARKELVEIISQVVGCKKVYKGMPSAAYEVGNFIISKDGTVSYNEQTEGSIIQAILEKTATAGFTAETKEAATPAGEPDAQAKEADLATAVKDTGLVISFPADKVNLENLQKLLKSKSKLIKKPWGLRIFRLKKTTSRSAFLGGLPCRTLMPSPPTLLSWRPFAK